MNRGPGDVQPGTPTAGGAEQEGAPQLDGPRPPRVTTFRTAILIGAVVTLLAAGASSLVSARLADRQSDLDEQRVEIAQLTSQVSQQESQIAQLAREARDGEDEVDGLNAEIEALEQQVRVLEAERGSLEEQLSQILNPAPGPTPTARLTAIWVQPYYLASTGSAPTAVCIEIENTSASDVSIWYSYSQFSAMDADNFVFPPRLHTPGYSIQLQTPLMDGQLGPGEKRRGELLYDAPLVITRLVWSAGFGETPEIAVDLPAVAQFYSPSTTPC
jgi:outer membrane murein-binding lipoprotein Lpp